MKKIQVKKVEDITGRYWAFINKETGEEINSCYRKVMPDDDDGYSYDEAKDRAKEVCRYFYGEEVEIML